MDRPPETQPIRRWWHRWCVIETNGAARARIHSWHLTHRSAVIEAVDVTEDAGDRAMFAGSMPDPLKIWIVRRVIDPGVDLAYEQGIVSVHLNDELGYWK